MLQLASGKSVPVMMNRAALSDPEKTKSLRLPILRGEIGGREVDVMRDTGCEGVVVRRQLVDASQLTARSPEDPDMSVMVGATTTRAQAKRDAVTKPLRVPDMERHGGVDREQLIKLQQEEPRIQELVDAGRTSRRGGKVVSYEKTRGIVYRRYDYPGLVVVVVVVGVVVVVVVFVVVVVVVVAVVAVVAAVIVVAVDVYKVCNGVCVCECAREARDVALGTDQDMVTYTKSSESFTCLCHYTTVFSIHNHPFPVIPRDQRVE
ncbi:hypothetical protein ElyMa_006204200 [Elysia marginata]|uniref:Uncharacterized protein n=1 Tax=Elysia marginata TaxID=1093978 RepID=A0AAV4H769_9GAST|nr:hypothetical protein ElyMa_006204200 [Elysia marginata]